MGSNSAVARARQDFDLARWVGAFVLPRVEFCMEMMPDLEATNEDGAARCAVRSSANYSATSRHSASIA